MSGDPKSKIIAFCNGMIRVIKTAYPDVEKSDITPNPYQCGRLRAYEKIKENMEGFEKTYTISTILQMLESQYGETSIYDKLGREMLVKELDDFEAMN